MLKNCRLNVKPLPAEAIRGWFQHRAIEISGKVRLMNGEKRLFKASRLTLGMGDEVNLSVPPVHAGLYFISVLVI